MSQRGQVDLFHILETDVETSFEHGPHLARQDNGLGATRAGTAANIFVGSAHRKGTARVRAHDQTNGIVLNWRGNDDLADELLIAPDVVAVDDLLDIGPF